MDSEELQVDDVEVLEDEDINAVQVDEVELEVEDVDVVDVLVDIEVADVGVKNCWSTRSRY